MIDIKKRPVLRITIDAMCLALYIVLSSFCPETLFFKITFDSIPLIFVSLVGGPLDGVIVAACGSVINDAITGYLNFLTPLWMLPAVLRAFIIGITFLNKDISKHKFDWVMSVIITTILVTAVNSAIMLLDGKIFGYPVQFTLLTLGIRIAAGIIVSILNIFLIPVLIKALTKAGFLKEKEI